MAARSQFDISTELDYDSYRSAAGMFHALIQLNFETMERTPPTTQEGLLWCLTELSEATEIAMGSDPKWVRNNPEDHEENSKDRLAEELGDLIYMAIVTAEAAGIPNPLVIMVDKIQKQNDNPRL